MCDLSKYYFYYLYIHVYFIKCNVSFLIISEYPHEFHDLHKDYPHAPERLQIKENLLSDYQHHLLQDEGFSKPPHKLAPNLRNKTNTSLPQFKVALETGVTSHQRPSCVVVQSITKFEKLHQLQHSSTYSCEK